MIKYFIIYIPVNFFVGDAEFLDANHWSIPTPLTNFKKTECKDKRNSGEFSIHRLMFYLYDNRNRVRMTVTALKSCSKSRLRMVHD